MIEAVQVAAERRQLYALMCAGEIDDEARRRIENELDLREAQLARRTDPDER